eukprot:IDg11269t1
MRHVGAATRVNEPGLGAFGSTGVFNFSHEAGSYFADEANILNFILIGRFGRFSSHNERRPFLVFVSLHAPVMWVLSPALVDFLANNATVVALLACFA